MRGCDGDSARVFQAGRSELFVSLRVDGTSQHVRLKLSYYWIMSRLPGSSTSGGQRTHLSQRIAFEISYMRILYLINYLPAFLVVSSLFVSN